MSKTIITKLVSPPHSKKIHIDCKNCWTRFHFKVPVDQAAGIFECDVCGAKTSWREVDELTTLEKDASVSLRY